MGRFLIAALAALFLAFPAQAAEELPGPYPAEVLRVLDGDTFQAKVHLWLDLDLTTSVRLAGIDAPELHGKCPGEPEAAQAARDHLAHLLAGGSVNLTDVRASCKTAEARGFFAVPERKSEAPATIFR